MPAAVSGKKEEDKNVDSTQSPGPCKLDLDFYNMASQPPFILKAYH